MPVDYTTERYISQPWKSVFSRFPTLTLIFSPRRVTMIHRNNDNLND